MAAFKMAQRLEIDVLWCLVGPYCYDGFSEVSHQLFSLYQMKLLTIYVQCTNHIVLCTSITWSLRNKHADWLTAFCTLRRGSTSNALVI